MAEARVRRARDSQPRESRLLRGQQPGHRGGARRVRRAAEQRRRGRAGLAGGARSGPALRAPEVGMAASKILVCEDPTRIDKAGHLIFPDGQNRGRGTRRARPRAVRPRRGSALARRLRRHVPQDRCWTRSAASTRTSSPTATMPNSDCARASPAGGACTRRARWCGTIAAPPWGRTRRARLELIERNRVLLAVKLFPWSLLWLNPFYFALRLAAGLLAARRGRRRHRAFPGTRRQAARWPARSWRAIWRRCACCRACCASARQVLRRALARPRCGGLMLAHRLGWREVA